MTGYHTGRQASTPQVCKENGSWQKTYTNSQREGSFHVWRNSEWTFFKTFILLLFTGSSYQPTTWSFPLLPSFQGVKNTALSCAFTLRGTALLSSSVGLVNPVVISDKGQHTVCPWGNLPAVSPPWLLFWAYSPQRAEYSLFPRAEPFTKRFLTQNWRLRIWKRPLCHLILPSFSRAALPTTTREDDPTEMQPLCRFLKSLRSANLRRLGGHRKSRAADTAHGGKGTAQLWRWAPRSNQCFKGRAKQLKTLTGECQPCSLKSWVTRNRKHSNDLWLNLIPETDGVLFPPQNGLLTWLENHFWAFTPSPVA